ncbi:MULTISPECIES: hypothetical protein [unclassified Pseudomonas]|uniref:hypothetical protein n=1 Tax=unclassified Pseudomonas TaxID=196821 RepID=UPI00382A7C5D
MHDRSLAPNCGFLHENSKLRRLFNSSNEHDGAHYRLSAELGRFQSKREFFKFISVTGGAGQLKNCSTVKNLQPRCDFTPNLEHQYK